MTDKERIQRLERALAALTHSLANYSAMVAVDVAVQKSPDLRYFLIGSEK